MAFISQWNLGRKRHVWRGTCHKHAGVERAVVLAEAVRREVREEWESLGLGFNLCGAMPACSPRRARW